MSATVSSVTLILCLFVLFVESRKFRPGILSDYNDYDYNDDDWNDANNNNYDYFFKV